MLRTSPRAPRATALAVAAVVGLALSACSEAATTDPGPDVEFTDGKGITAEVLPRMADTGDEPESSEDAAWVVDATIDGAESGRQVVAQVADGDDWETVAEAETDANGLATLAVEAEGEFRVVSEGDGETVGITLDTADVPAATFADEMDEDTGVWATRDQGYVGVRLCSRASDDAVEYVDGVLRLSVLNDPDKGTCPEKRQRFDYRLNGHVGAPYTFTYGHAAARIKFQPERGQHGSFWLQAFPAAGPGPAKDTGAEIDVIEYFGDGHEEGGLTSFVYWHPDEKGKTAGGWVKDPEQYGGDWSSKYHVFSVDWTPEKYVFRIDGQITHVIEEGVSGQPQFMILSLLSSDYELVQLGDEAKLPQAMDVDWVKVWADPEHNPA